MPPLLQTGFRPFFLAAGAYAALVVPLWIAAFTGNVLLPTAMAGIVWHAHEMLLGFTGAVVAGFLLTAVRNWTGRPTLAGAPLAGLVAVWATGRALAVLGAPAPLSAVVDALFWIGLAVGIGRPLVATKNRRNFGFIGAVLGLGLLDATVHVWPGGALVALRGALDVILGIVVVITGRIVPMFTANAVADARVVRRPRWDQAALGGVAVLVLAELAGLGPVGAVGAGVAGVAVLVRGAGWGLRAALGVPLLAVLHVGHGWLGVGLLLRAAEVAGAPVPATAATHAITVGAIGLLTIGMMARVSLGHTGRPMVAPRAATAAFVLVGLAALVRELAAFVPSPLVLAAAAALFSGGFGLFAVTYAPWLLAARPDGRPG